MKDPDQPKVTSSANGDNLSTEPAEDPCPMKPQPRLLREGRKTAAKSVNDEGAVMVREGTEKPAAPLPVRKVKDPALHRLSPTLKPALAPKKEITVEDVEGASWGVSDHFDSSGRTSEKNRKFVLVGIVFLLVALTGLAWVVKMSPEVAAVPESEYRSDGRDAVEDSKVAIKLVRSFVEAATIEDRLKLVRHPELTAARMRHYYRTESPRFGELEISRAQEGAFDGKIDLIWLTYRFEGDTWRTAILEHTSDGLKLDWESFVAFEELPFGEYVRSESRESRVYRLTVKRDDYYNYRYQDTDKFVSYYVRDPRRRGSCWAYVNTNSVQDDELTRLFERADQLAGRKRDSGALASTEEIVQDLSNAELESTINVILRIRFVPHVDGSAHRQALIEEILSDSWFLP